MICSKRLVAENALEPGVCVVKIKWEWKNEGDLYFKRYGY
jgi:hypothetical protein